MPLECQHAAKAAILRHYMTVLYHPHEYSPLYRWRSKIPHFRRDKIPQLTILGEMPEVVKNVRNGGMVCAKRHVSTGNEHKPDRQTNGS